LNLELFNSPTKYIDEGFANVAQAAVRSPSAPMMNGPAVGQPVVLVVEDEPQMRRFLVSALAENGLRTVHVGTRAGMRAGAVAHDPDLVVLDVGNVGTDGVGLTARLRQWTAAPIVAVLDSSAEVQRNRLLDAGADDYLVKPFESADLLARVRVWLKQSGRTRSRFEPDAAFPHLRIDRDRHCLVVDGREVHITPLEYKLLDTLARTSVAMSEAQVLHAVWGRGDIPPVQYLRAHLRQLRHKIEKDPTRPRHLVGEPSAGYRLRLG
jgi:two-component system KDP operon response regulator KdpE